LKIDQWPGIKDAGSGRPVGWEAGKLGGWEAIKPGSDAARKPGGETPPIRTRWPIES